MHQRVYLLIFYNDPEGRFPAEIQKYFIKYFRFMHCIMHFPLVMKPKLCYNIC